MKQLSQNLREYYCRTIGALDTIPEDVCGDGSIRGMDYRDPSRGSSWTPARHLRVMCQLCPNFPDMAGRMLEHWLKMEVDNTNWWWPEIGFPLAVCKTLLMLDRTIAKDSREWKLLSRAHLGMTGQNKVWCAEIHLMKGLLVGDEPMIQEGLALILSEIAVSDGEGLKSDWSFQQHGMQLQFGNYGLSWFDDMSQWLIVCTGTKYAFPAEKARLIEGYFTHGLRWTLTRRIMDVNACGRQFGYFLPGAVCLEERKRQSILATVSRLQHAGYLQNVEMYPMGTVSYPESGYMLHRGKDFFFSVRMSSSRIRGSETCNSENMQGLYSGDGGTFLYKHERWDTAELALRDWRKVPGTTEVIDDEPLVPNRHNNTEGACRCWSDGEFGAAMLQLKNEKINALKAYFILGDCVVCMGGGITTWNSLGEVATTLVQQLKVGDVLMNGKRLSDGETSCAGRTEFLFGGIRYVLPEAGSYHLSIEERTGDWNKIHFDCPSLPAEGTMFTVWCSHGEKPVDGAYAYMLMPEMMVIPEVTFLRADGILGIRTGECTMVACFQSGMLNGHEFAEPGLYLDIRGQKIRK